MGYFNGWRCLVGVITDCYTTDAYILTKLGGSTQQGMDFELVGGLPTPLADLHANSMVVRERGRGGCLTLEPVGGTWPNFHINSFNHYQRQQQPREGAKVPMAGLFFPNFDISFPLFLQLPGRKQ